MTAFQTLKPSTLSREAFIRAFADKIGRAHV